MEALAFLIAVYALLMLLLHVLTGKILNAWKHEPDSRMSRWFTSRRILRTEALFWALALASWFLWQSWEWKLVVVTFAVLHIAVWGAGEMAVSGKTSRAPRPSVLRAIVAFDLVEAVALAGIATTAIAFLAHVQ